MPKINQLLEEAEEHHKDYGGALSRWYIYDEFFN